jgi:hypothetical protein
VTHRSYKRLLASLETYFFTTTQPNRLRLLSINIIPWLYFFNNNILSRLYSADINPVPWLGFHRLYRSQPSIDCAREHTTIRIMTDTGLKQPADAINYSLKMKAISDILKTLTDDQEDESEDESPHFVSAASRSGAESVVGDAGKSSSRSFAPVHVGQPKGEAACKDDEMPPAPRTVYLLSRAFCNLKLALEDISSALHAVLSGHELGPILSQKVVEMGFAGRELLRTCQLVQDFEEVVSKDYDEGGEFGHGALAQTGDGGVRHVNQVNHHGLPKDRVALKSDFDRLTEIVVRLTDCVTQIEANKADAL